MIDPLNSPSRDISDCIEHREIYTKVSSPITLSKCLLISSNFKEHPAVTTMKLSATKLLVLSFICRVISEISPLSSRQNNDACSHGSLLGQIGGGNGGRKIGIVIDISASMADTDPNDLRLAAAKELGAKLITQSTAIDGKTPDLLTVVHFNSDASVVYSLGDPALANFDHVEPIDGTFIGGGIKAAVDELTKPGNDPTNNRTGIVVFTDGIDDPPEQIPSTIAEIQRAGGLGITVSFGFLSIANEDQDEGILKAILQTGGIFTAFNDPKSQESFITLVFSHGLTGIDRRGESDQALLLSGLRTSSLLSQTGTNTFTYSAKLGETFNITVSTKDNLNLVATLRDIGGNVDIMSQLANITAPAFMEYTAPSNIDVEVVIKASGPTFSGVFSIELQSSISGTDNCLPATNTTQPTTNTTQPGNNTQTSHVPTPTPTSPPIFTGNGCTLNWSWQMMGAHVVLFFMFAIWAL
jgi:Mg-chelatase subunit ChlD